MTTSTYDEGKLPKGIRSRIIPGVNGLNVELIDGAGHWIQQEQPARLAKLLLAFHKS